VRQEAEALPRAVVESTIGLPHVRDGDAVADRRRAGHLAREEELENASRSISSGSGSSFTTERGRRLSRRR